MLSGRYSAWKVVVVIVIVICIWLIHIVTMAMAVAVDAPRVIVSNRCNYRNGIIQLD